MCWQHHGRINVRGGHILFLNWTGAHFLCSISQNLTATSMFIKRMGGRRVAARAVSHATRNNDFTAHNHYSGSAAGVEMDGRVIEVPGEGPPLKRVRVFAPQMDQQMTEGAEAQTVGTKFLYL